MKLLGRHGRLRIYDSSPILHGQAPLDNLTIDVVTFDGVATWANITSDVEADDAAAAANFLADNNDKVYIGSTSKFAMFRYLKGAGSDYAIGSGAMIAKYFNGTNFNTALAGVADGTLSGGDCFAQDGYVGFRIPPDWAIGANAFNANLDADKYYIEIACTTSPTTDPDADVLCPVDGQYFEVPFAEMDFSGPLARKLREEILVMDRGTMDSKAHYILGPDDVIYEPLELSFSSLLHTTYKDRVIEAMNCGNPGADRWTGAGVSTKGDTTNDGVNANPAFADATKKTVNLQVLWDTLRTGAIPFGIAYYEVYFPPGEQAVNESAEGIPVASKGGVYGVIERLYGFGNRY